MRIILVGLLLLGLPSLARAQARGEVESIGFQGVFRPGCWTPMVVRLVPTTGKTFTGRITVHQLDLDHDDVAFTRQITLTGNPPGGGNNEQRFWMYFIPQPNALGTNESIDGSRTTAELTNLIKVRLCDESGKPLEILPITQAVNAVDKTGMNSTRGQKLVLCVGSRSVPNLREYEQMVGLVEDISMVTVGENSMAGGLPENVIGYDAVDAIVWADADPDKLSSLQMQALTDFIKRGGKFIILQDTNLVQWQRNNTAFAPLMPVVVTGVESRNDLSTLRRLADAKDKDAFWDSLRAPFPYAIANVKPEARVIEWDDAVAKRPWMVRMGVGAGSVTWVAQDLGDARLREARNIANIESTSHGWARVFDRVFDLRNDPVSRKDSSEKDRQPFAAASTIEMGKLTTKYMDLPSTSAALIGIAVLFFIVYWIIAGPGSYLFLLTKKRSSFSWIAFAGIAVAATALTFAIVKLTLRGPPKAHHLSIIRSIPGEPTLIYSSVGVYIPRDGEQAFELKDTAPNKASYITAFNLHPAYNESATSFPSNQPYTIPVLQVQAQGKSIESPTQIKIPYRSTLKRFQASWQGDTPDLRIDGKGTLHYARPIITGTLTNYTGQKLQNVYIAFNHPGDKRDLKSPVAAEDWILHIPDWDAGKSIDLGAQFQLANQGGARTVIKDDGPYNRRDNTPPNQSYKGPMGTDRLKSNDIYGWAAYFYDRFELRSPSYGDRVFADSNPLSPSSFVILSLFDRLSISRNQLPNAMGNDGRNDKVDLNRRGSRHLDLSAALSAGNMVILAVVPDENSPIPFNLQVAGDKVNGVGYTYLQFVVPIDRSQVMDAPPTSRPSPTTQKSSDSPGNLIPPVKNP